MSTKKRYGLHAVRGMGRKDLVRYALTYRTAFIPVYLYLTLMFLGTVMHVFSPHLKPLPVGLGLIIGLVVWQWGEKLSRPVRGLIAVIVPTAIDEGERGVLDGRNERAYIASTIFCSGLWCTAIAAVGLTVPVWISGTVGTVCIGIPFWWKRTVKHTAVLDRYARRWPTVAESVPQLSGSTVVPNSRHHTGTMRGGTTLFTVRLKPGQTMDMVGRCAPNIASVFGLRTGSVTLAPGRAANLMDVRIVPTDPWAKFITHPILHTPTTELMSIRDSNTFPMGVKEDGEYYYWKLFHTLVFGQSGSGKSAWIDSLLIWLFSHKDVMVVGSDMGGGTTLEVWQSLMAAPVASDCEGSLDLLKRLRAELDHRLLALAKQKGDGLGDDVLEPSDEYPALVTILDEWPTLVAEGGQDVLLHMGILAKQGRKVNMWFIPASQNASKDDVGNTGLRAQFRNMIGFRLDSQQSMNAWKELSKQGWSSVGLDVGVFLPHDQDHLTPQATKGFFIRKEERRDFILSRQGVIAQGNEHTRRILRGDNDVSDHKAVLRELEILRKTTADKILELLQESDHPMRPVEFHAAIGGSLEAVNKALRLLKESGQIYNPSYGKYELTN